jgi:hypothetical protein
MKSESSLPQSQVPATCSYPEPAQSSPSTQIPLSEIHLHSESALYRLLIFHVQNIVSHFLCTKVFVQAWGLLLDWSEKQFVFTVRSWLSATAYSIYSELPSILHTVPPPASWGRGMSWRQEHTYDGQILINVKYINCTDLRRLDSEKLYL